MNEKEYIRLRSSDEVKRSLVRGGKTLENVFASSKQKNISVLSAEDANKLTNIYALRLSEIMMIAASHGMSVDIEGYEKLREEEHKERKTVKHAIPKPRM